MAIITVCSSCNAKLRLPDNAAGRKARCPKCGTVLTVPDEEVEELSPVAEAEPDPEPDEEPEEARVPRKRRRVEEDDDVEEDEEEERPRRRRRPARKKGGGGSRLILALVLGGVALVLLVGLGGLLLWFVLPENNSRLTRENIEKIKGGMKLDEAEAIVGRGRKATESDIQQANELMGAPAGVPGAPVPNLAKIPGMTTYVWRNRTTWLFVDVDDTTRTIRGLRYMSRGGS